MKDWINWGFETAGFWAMAYIFGFAFGLSIIFLGIYGCISVLFG